MTEPAKRKRFRVRMGGRGRLWSTLAHVPAPAWPAMAALPWRDLRELLSTHTPAGYRPSIVTGAALHRKTADTISLVVHGCEIETHNGH